MSSLLQLHHLSGACHACTSSWYPLSIREPQLNEFYIASDHLFHCLLQDELLGIVTNILVWHFSSYSNKATRGERKSKIKNYANPSLGLQKEEQETSPSLRIYFTLPHRYSCMFKKWEVIWVRGGHHMRVSLCQGGVGCLFFAKGGGGG